MVAKIEHKQRTACPLACALDIVGDHWTLLIVRNLMFLGIHEYKDMLKTAESISSSILTNRLKKLELDGLIASIAHPDSQRRKLYYLTTMGKDLIYLMTELILWAHKNMAASVNIPEHKKVMLEKDPEQFIRLTLQELDTWEKQFVPNNTAGSGAMCASQ